MDYLTFYHLTEDPFRLTPDPHFFYPSQEHNDALLSLDYGIEQKEGFSLILGGPGTGKTTILRVFMDKWKDKAEIALIMTPRLSPEEFLQALLEDLNAYPKTSNKNEMIKAFRDMLVERSLSGKRVIIVVDEAQNLPDETLEELRLLSNLETEKEKLLQIMLVGQLELRTKLSSQGLEQLNQRIAVKAALNSLNVDETRNYINYRLIKAGKGSAVFDDGAVKLIYKLSRGIPRKINLLCSRALMAAYVEGSLLVGKHHVEYARQHLSAGQPRKHGRVRIVPYALASVVLVALMSFVFAKAGTSDRIHQALGRPVVGSTTAPSALREASVKRTAVFTTDANLREGPSKETRALTWARQGTIFDVIEEQNGDGGRTWYKLKAQDGREAWASEKVLKVHNKRLK